jgi:peptide deformylase
MILRAPFFTWLLHRESKPVTVQEINSHKFQKLIQRMANILDGTYGGTGKGLAAPQLGIFKRVFIIRIGDGHDFEVCINPIILSSKGRVSTYAESCLSTPGKWYEVVRCRDIEVRYLNEKGVAIRAKYHDYDAECFQHELDHLNGILLPDRGFLLRKRRPVK